MSVCLRLWLEQRNTELWNEKTKLVHGEKREKQMSSEKQIWKGRVERGRETVRES